MNAMSLSRVLVGAMLLAPTVTAGEPDGTREYEFRNGGTLYLDATGEEVVAVDG